jgi:pyruvate formate-lyase activating enzyme-like uncharacterized protein
MSHSTFFAIAKDPTIIPGVDHHCDEWCDYCLVTNRSRSSDAEYVAKPGLKRAAEADSAHTVCGKLCVSITR